MRSLVAFSLLLAAVAADPQLLYHAGVLPTAYTGSIYPGYSPYIGTPVVTSPVVASPVLAKSVYPVQDTSRGLPQPVQDTPEVQQAKAEFSKHYEQAVFRNAAVTPVVHSIQKRQIVYTPQTYSSGLVYSNPSVYSSPSVVRPYVSSYNYPATTYSAYTTPLVHSIHKREALYTPGSSIYPAVRTSIPYVSTHGTYGATPLVSTYSSYHGQPFAYNYAY